jgi:hypothetical protein
MVSSERVAIFRLLLQNICPKNETLSNNIIKKLKKSEELQMGWFVFTLAPPIAHAHHRLIF